MTFVKKAWGQILLEVATSSLYWLTIRQREVGCAHFHGRPRRVVRTLWRSDGRDRQTDDGWCIRRPLLGGNHSVGRASGLNRNCGALEAGHFGNRTVVS